jgi:hypothetical protein
MTKSLNLDTVILQLFLPFHYFLGFSFFFLNVTSSVPKYKLFWRKNCIKSEVALYHQWNINCSFSYYILNYLFIFILSILQFIFLIQLITDNFVKQLVISFFHTILITFLNLSNMVKITYILIQMEYQYTRHSWEKSNTLFWWLLFSLVFFIKNES